jgi:hypothetical protein
MGPGPMGPGPMGPGPMGPGGPMGMPPGGPGGPMGPGARRRARARACERRLTLRPPQEDRWAALWARAAQWVAPWAAQAAQAPWAPVALWADRRVLSDRRPRTSSSNSSSSPRSNSTTSRRSSSSTNRPRSSQVFARPDVRARPSVDCDHRRRTPEQRRPERWRRCGSRHPPRPHAPDHALSATSSRARGGARVRGRDTTPFCSCLE